MGEVFIVNRQERNTLWGKRNIPYLDCDATELCTLVTLNLLNFNM